jgi:hypothetical protein
MKRAWIGVALLATSWLFGLNYYHQPNGYWWCAIIVIAAGLFSSVASRWPSRIECAAAVVLVLPAIALAPWAYRAAPALIAVGLAPIAAGLTYRPVRSIAASLSIAGIVAVAQSLALLL